MPNSIRFSRVLEINPKVLQQNKIWWPSKTFYNKVGHQVCENTSDEFHLNIGPEATKEQCVFDQTNLLLKSEDELKEILGKESDTDEDFAVWRFGPAQFLYDKMGVSEEPKEFDYGFKLESFDILNLKPQKPLISHDLFVEELLPVDLMHWEDDIILDSKKVNLEKILASSKNGWVLTKDTSTYQDYKIRFMSSADEIDGPELTHSIFPLENFELENTRWEDNIILDAENMKQIPRPCLLAISYDEDPTAFPMSDEVLSEEQKKDRHEPCERQSRIIFSRVKRRQNRENEEVMEELEIAQKDPFNLSNDEYYAPKRTQREIGTGTAVQHSIPAMNLHSTFFPTHLDLDSLRRFNREVPQEHVLKPFLDRQIRVKNSLNYQAEVAEERKQQMLVDVGAEVFQMREVKDLSARDGTLVFIEYSEEFPPLFSRPGMGSKIRNYISRTAQRQNTTKFDFGETAFTMHFPFLGALSSIQSLQSIENNMYRAPIYKHTAPTTDFILIRCEDGLFLREFTNTFVAGQECPLMEVPSPKSKKAAEFDRNRLFSYIYRLFWESEHEPKRLLMTDLQRAFPNLASSTIRSRLKKCASYTRSDSAEQNYWVLKSDFNLPRMEEVVSMLTPETCCAYFSMQAAEQRLKDAGYGDKHFLTPENDLDNEVKLEEEIKSAPWNTTKTYLKAISGKCMLDQTGIADPTGCGEAFSFTNAATKAQKSIEPKPTKRIVSGTRADLRKLPLKEAREICRANGVREEEINALTRWQLVDLVRNISTNAALTNRNSGDMLRFARGNTGTITRDNQEKYNQYCQRIFDLQNEKLASTELICTDNESDADDADLKSHKSLNAEDVQMEDEEKELEELRQMLSEDLKKEEVTDSSKDQLNPSTSNANVFRRLRIHRIYTDAEGGQTEEIEFVTNQQVIDGYTLMQTKDRDFIKVYSMMDKEYKEEQRKLKRRSLDKIRREKRKKQKMDVKLDQEKSKKTPSFKKDLTLKCGACGQKGHMRTNRSCPMFGQKVDDEKKLKEEEQAEERVETIGDVARFFLRPPKQATETKKVETIGDVARFYVGVASRSSTNTKI